MTLQFRKATKSESKLRLAIFGPSGSGKTFSALRIASGLGGKIAVIDTERGSASKYADRFDFDVLELPKMDIDTYCEGIRAATDYDVLLIDSLSHGWQELLEEVEKIARQKYRGNTWSAWRDGTPKQRKLVDSILGFSGHVIATMRSKTEWTTGQTDNGKLKPVRVGLAPEQGKGIEYEFDLLMELDVDHVATVLKDRTGKFQDSVIEKPDEGLGEELATWLGLGEPLATDDQLKKIRDLMVAASEKFDNDAAIDGALVKRGYRPLVRLFAREAKEIITKMETPKETETGGEDF